MVDCKTCIYENVCLLPDFVRNDLKLCGNYQQKKIQTNAERIRVMTDDQLAEFLDNYKPENIANEWCLHLCPDRKDGDCDCPYGGYETALGWLKSEAKENS